MITQEKAYCGALARIGRLGLAVYVDEVRQMLGGLAAVVLPSDLSADYERYEVAQRALEGRLAECQQWKAAAPGLWMRSHRAGDAEVCLGLTITLAGGTETRGIGIIRKAVYDGLIDVGVLVILGDEIGDRCDDPPLLLTTRRRMIETVGERLPLLSMRFCLP